MKERSLRPASSPVEPFKARIHKPRIHKHTNTFMSGSGSFRRRSPPFFFGATPQAAIFPGDTSDSSSRRSSMHGGTSYQEAATILGDEEVDEP